MQRAPPARAHNKKRTTTQAIRVRAISTTLKGGSSNYLFWGTGTGTNLTNLEVDDTPAQPNRDRLGPITGAQLFHDVLDVNLYGFLGDK